MNRWHRIETIFFEALERPAGERPAYLQEACQDDHELRRELEEMLAAHEEERALTLERRFLREEAPTESPVPAQTRIGPYQLLEVLGEGGMGTVYLARRDDSQYRQDVALKLMRPGLNARDLETRFRTERQILASLQHPNVARLLDGGVTGDGRPYLVMEYVQGIPLTRHCDEHRLTIPERLRRFQVVCRAVQFAHRNLVVHRDLKPGNIMVTDEGEVKLLDFGIAKMLDPSSLELPVAETQTDVRVMTPEYAAPEQVRGESVTTATDVYALGVLLYELLTGHRPYRLPGKRQSEIERIICEEMPTRPSTIVGQPVAHSDDAESSVEISAARSTGPDRLRRTLRGDLDNIVLRALAKEPERRYASAEQLAEDVDRYLRGEVVLARKDTLGYRTSKFIRRHRTGVAAAAAIALLLIAFAVVTLQQARIVARERDLANAERDRAELAQLQAEEVSEFVMELFSASDPSEARGDTVTAVELLDRGEERVEQLRNQPSVQARMMGVLGQVNRFLGRFDRSEPLLEQAVTTWRRLGERDQLARSLNHLGLLRISQGKLDEADSLLREGLAIRRDLFDPPHPDLAESMHNLGGLALEKGEFSLADSLLRSAYAMRESIFGEDHVHTIRTLHVLSVSLQRGGRSDEAERVLRRILAHHRSTYGNVHPETARSLNNLAIVVGNRGDYEAADSLYRETLSVRRELYGARSSPYAVALVNYAKLLTERGLLEGAIGPLEEAIGIFREIHGELHPDVAWAIQNLGSVHEQNRNLELAASLFRQALLIQQKTLGETHPRTATTMLGLARTLGLMGHDVEAERLLLVALEIDRASYGPVHLNTATVQLALGEVYLRQDRHAEADAHVREALQSLRALLPEGHPRIATALLVYGDLLRETGAYADAAPVLQEAVAIRRKSLDPSDPTIRDAQEALDAVTSELRRTPAPGGPVAARP